MSPLVKNSRDKPVAALRKFARRWGWSPLWMWQDKMPYDASQSLPTLVTWYESGSTGGLRRHDLFLQINEHPIGQIRVYEAAVYATRYYICTGWHTFELTADLKFSASQAERLDGWLNHRWFEAPTARRQFRQDHPQCAGYSWKRIQDVGPPVVDAR